MLRLVSRLFLSTKSATDYLIINERIASAILFFAGDEMKDHLTADGVKALLSGALEERFSLIILDTVDSTNTYLKKLAENAPEYTVVIASNQTAGRGRLGRSFFSPDGTGVYMSVLLKPSAKAADALFITTAAAVAVCRALDYLGVRGHGIKWVNDIYLSEKKICGILTEGKLSKGGALDYAVLGVGVNFYEPSGEFPSEISSIAGAVFQSEKENAKNEFVAEFLEELYALYNENNGKYIAEYADRSCVLGKRATVVTPDGEKEALILSITDKCALTVKFDDGSVAELSRGEISLRNIAF